MLVGPLELNKVHQGDVLDLLKQVPDDSIDLVVSSPPYWGLRAYGKETETVWGGVVGCEHDWQSEKFYKDSPTRDRGQPGRENAPAAGGSERWHESRFCSLCGAWRGQLGLEPTVELYIDHLLQVFRELKRVLKPSGSFYLNLGDTYASSMGNHGGETAGFSKSSMVEDKPAKPKHPALGRVLIPHRVALRMLNEGWMFPDEIIWYKRNHMPSSVKGRLANSWEIIFRVVKNSEAILWRVYRDHGIYKDGQWLHSRPPTPFREWLLRENWYGHVPGEWISKKPPRWIVKGNHAYTGFNDKEEAEQFKEMLSQPDAELFSGRRLWSKSRTNWLGFAYYYELDAIRVPHETEGTGKFNIRVRDKKLGRLDEKWGPLTAATDEEAQSYNEKLYGGKMSKGDVDPESLNSPRARLMRTQQRIGDAHEGKATANLYSPDRVSFYHEKGKNRGDVAGLEGTKGLNVPGQEVQHGLRIPGHQGDWQHEDGKNPGNIFFSEGSGRIIELDGSLYEIQTMRRIELTGTDCPYDEYDDETPSGENWDPSFWDITTKPMPEAHFAVFPEDLCEPPILSSCPPNGVVLDPFAGSGTTGVVAKKLGRQFLLFEISRKYCKIAEKRLGQVPERLDKFS